MNHRENISRRQFMAVTAIGVAGVSTFKAGADIVKKDNNKAKRLPLKIGIRQASLLEPGNPKKKMTGNLDTFKVARQVPGIIGVELQVTGGTNNMRDMDIVRWYKKEANRWGLDIPSIAGVFDRGTLDGNWGPSAGVELVHAIRVAELLGASVVLVAFFDQNAPNLMDENSYGPIVDLFQKLAPLAADAGVIMGLENSLTPEDNKKLVDIIDRQSVKVYYDVFNMFRHGADQAVAGIKLLGKERMCAVHVKNDYDLIEKPDRINWELALRLLSEIGYDGWLIFETKHKSLENCIDDTQKNIAFIKNHFQPPLG